MDEYRTETDFFKEQFRGWIGNLLRDLDAQKKEIPLVLIANALQEVSDEIIKDVQSIASWDDQE